MLKFENMMSHPEITFKWKLDENDKLMILYEAYPSNKIVVFDIHCGMTSVANEAVRFQLEILKNYKIFYPVGAELRDFIDYDSL